MNIYKLLFVLAVVSYGGLTILAGAIQLKQKKIHLISSLSMALGGFLLIFSLSMNFSIDYKILMLTAGLIIIQIAAISNGFQIFGRINPRHHFIRLGVSIFVIVLFFLK